MSFISWGEDSESSESYYTELCQLKQNFYELEDKYYALKEQFELLKTENAGLKDKIKNIEMMQ